MESPAVWRSAFMETLPPQMIRVEKPQRATTCETIAEERWSGECLESRVTLAEVAPAPVITVKKQAFQSSLDTIWEDTMHYVMAEYLASGAAEVMLRPALRFKDAFENFSQSRSWGVVHA